MINLFNYNFHADQEIEGRGNRAEQLYMSGDTTMITVGGG